MEALASKVDRRGTVVLPAKLRRRLGIAEGTFVVAEEGEDGPSSSGRPPSCRSRSTHPNAKPNFF
jgi:AbrB family looped-hinge helix DNA binding protein